MGIMLGKTCTMFDDLTTQIRSLDSCLHQLDSGAAAPRLGGPHPKKTSLTIANQGFPLNIDPENSGSSVALHYVGL